MNDATPFGNLVHTLQSQRIRTGERAGESGTAAGEASLRGRISALFAREPQLRLQAAELAQRFDAPLHSVRTQLSTLRREGTLCWLALYSRTEKPWVIRPPRRQPNNIGLRPRLRTLFEQNPLAQLTCEEIADQFDLELQYVRTMVGQLRQLGFLCRTYVWTRA